MVTIIKMVIIAIIILIISPYIPHHDVDKGVLYEGEEDEEGAGGHEHVNRLFENIYCILYL